MHHEDYNRPLEVVFCCAAYHDVLDARREARLRATLPRHGEEDAQRETVHAAG